MNADSTIKFPLFLSAIWFSLIFTGCDSPNSVEGTTTFSENGTVHAVIEIPAGTNLKLELNHESGDIEPDQEDGKDRVIQYLPYPGNYGFIPGTSSDRKEGGDGDPLDVIVLSSAVHSGTVLEIKPIAILQLLDEGEKDFKIIAIPIQENERVVDANGLAELHTKYPGVTQIIETWFSHYNPKDSVTIIGWADEVAALNEIKKSQIADE